MVGWNFFVSSTTTTSTIIIIVIIIILFIPTKINTDTIGNGQTTANTYSKYIHCGLRPVCPHSAMEKNTKYTTLSSITLKIHISIKFDKL